MTLCRRALAKSPIRLALALADQPVESIAAFERLWPADRARRRGLGDLGFQIVQHLFEQSDTLLQLFVFCPSLLRHGLHGFELLALNDVELAQNVFCLGTHHAFDLLAHALRRARRVGDELAELVEEPAGCLRHAYTL